jgi:2,3-bisphosphoglycerate-dependent phosphoglycerate mutase
MRHTVPGRFDIRLVVLAQHVHRSNHRWCPARRSGHLEAAAGERHARVGGEGRLTGADRSQLIVRSSNACRVDLEAENLDVGPSPRESGLQLQCCHAARAVAEIDDERVCDTAQRSLARDPPVNATKPIRAGRSPRRLPDGPKRSVRSGSGFGGHQAMMPGRYHGAMTAPYTLILLRHGQSEWNELNLFTGWVDVRLTEQGKAEATRGGELLAEADILPDVLYTSVLSRAIQTANLALDAADRLWIPVTRTWRLNERHYGALQGKDKAQTLEEFGQEQFMLWRRSFDVPPPELADDSEFSQVGDPRYDGIDGEVPRTESLKLVIDRLLPYWESTIAPDLRSGKTVLVTAHGNSLRALVKHLDGISDADIAELNIPTGIPLVYRLDEDLKPMAPAEYLDPEAAAAGAAAVANQGAK